MVLISNQTCIILAFDGGGGIVQSIISLSLFIVLIVSSYLFNEKINAKIIGASIVGLGAIVFAVFESLKINK